MASSTSNPLELSSSLRVVTYNCWGLKYIAKHRQARLAEIGRQLALAVQPPSIVGLQECWTQQDYLAIRDQTKRILPYGKFYWSGAIGGGLAILSKWPIEESRMHRYTLNGKPAAVLQGDWYVGKGVACARIRIGPGEKDVLEVFCTHLYAPGETQGLLNHRVAEAWEVAKLMRHAAERGHMVLGLGDYNSQPGELVIRLIEAHSPVRDVWRMGKPAPMVDDAQAEVSKRPDARATPSARECLEIHGATSDGVFNTWRWSKEQQRQLGRGKDVNVDPNTPDPGAKRLDYIFFYDNQAHSGQQWEIESVEVGMTMRHPTLKCSLSDHYSVEATLVQRVTNAAEKTPPRPPMQSPLPPETYDEILAMISKSDKRERGHRRLQLAHFFISAAISVGCFIAVWWSPHNYVSFILMLLSTLGLGTGILNGLIGFIFVGSELRALRELEFDVRCARDRALVARSI